MKIIDASLIPIEEIIRREDCNTAAVEKTVLDIINCVRENGDKALREYTKKFDGANLDSLEVEKSEIDEAYERTNDEIKEILNCSKENIAKFHKMQMRENFELSSSDGAILGQRFIPVEKAGVYVPGGTASYPSTVLMNIVPAVIAGVKEIIMVTPCGKDGKIADTILCAAKIARVSRVFKVGGAQAIAALAYGTESIPKVDKITGPGNIYVATAKKLVFGRVGIDIIAGPSEILIVADDSANAKFVAADLLSQAEHDKNASAILVTTSRDLANRVSDEVEKQLSSIPRADIARVSIENNGKIIIAENIDVALDIANKIAPEHLELCINNPREELGKVKNAGSVFLGNFTPEAVGDYFAGANHTLPTSGTARFSSALSVDDFMKKTQYICYSKSALYEASDKIIKFAEIEGLVAHGNSIAVRFEDDKNN
ncbi:MAG TPA: histidinol dehydrogenase [Clostridia bacterium]|nr:histidinol dehydrogenase [Clostridia bacterium]